jgi:hypothetical protein
MQRFLPNGFSEAHAVAGQGTRQRGGAARLFIAVTKN